MWEDPVKTLFALGLGTCVILSCWTGNLSQIASISSAAHLCLLYIVFNFFKESFLTLYQKVGLTCYSVVDKSPSLSPLCILF